MGIIHKTSSRVISATGVQWILDITHSEQVQEVHWILKIHVNLIQPGECALYVIYLTSTLIVLSHNDRGVVELTTGKGVIPEGAQEYTLLQEYYFCGTPTEKV